MEAERDDEAADQEEDQDSKAAQIDRAQQAPEHRRSGVLRDLAGMLDDDRDRGQPPEAMNMLESPARRHSQAMSGKR